MQTEDTAPQRQKQDDALLERTASITNRFLMLKVEESPEIDPAEVSEVAAVVSVPTKMKASKGKPEIAVYELEGGDGSDEELAFLISCQY